jgi:hypothetical protein
MFKRLAAWFRQTLGTRALNLGDELDRIYSELEREAQTTVKSASRFTNER